MVSVKNWKDITDDERREYRRIKSQEFRDRQKEKKLKAEQDEIERIERTKAEILKLVEPVTPVEPEKKERKKGSGRPQSQSLVLAKQVVKLTLAYDNLLNAYNDLAVETGRPTRS